MSSFGSIFICHLIVRSFGFWCACICVSCRLISVFLVRDHCSGFIMYLRYSICEWYLIETFYALSSSAKMFNFNWFKLSTRFEYRNYNWNGRTFQHEYSDCWEDTARWSGRYKKPNDPQHTDTLSHYICNFYHESMLHFNAFCQWSMKAFQVNFVAFEHESICEWIRLLHMQFKMFNGFVTTGAPLHDPTAESAKVSFLAFHRKCFEGKKSFDFSLIATIFD